MGCHHHHRIELHQGFHVFSNMLTRSQARAQEERERARALCHPEVLRASKNGEPRNILTRSQARAQEAALERARTLAPVLCHPEVLRAQNGELRNMRLVCKTFRDVVNRYVTRLAKTDDVIVTIPTFFPNIRVLCLARGFQHLVDLSSLPPLSNLRMLRIQSPVLTDISRVSGFTALEVLDLTGCPLMEMDGLEPLSACPKLKRLVMQACLLCPSPKFHPFHLLHHSESGYFSYTRV